MRIIKLGTEEFPNLDKVINFFEENLPSRTPPGKFRIPQKSIAEDGLKIGEKILFSYKCTVYYIAQSATGRLPNDDKYHNEYPFFFQIDVGTLMPTELSLHEIEKQFHQQTSETKSIVKSRKWVRIQNSQFTEKLWHSLGGKPAKSDATKKKYGSGGEGAEHKQLKEWIAENPQVIGLENVRQYELEHTYISGDAVDILFKLSDDTDIVVEIETNIPLPGCHQAIKYRVLRCAEKKLNLDSKNVRAIIVAWKIPEHVREFCNKYDIGYFEKKL